MSITLPAFGSVLSTDTVSGEEVQRMKAQVCHRQCSQSSKFSQAPRAVR